MRAEIIAVGSELLSFSRTETNSLYIASKLNPLGIKIARKFVVGDSEQEIREALQIALKASEIVVITGGLGPTNDDITREVVADCLGRELHESKEILELLERRYSRFGIRLTSNNRKQADVPEGAEILPNPHGTAPGLFLTEGEALIFLLPGPPRELYPMVENQVVPRIQKVKATSQRLMRLLKVAGEAESRVDARIESIYKEYPLIETTILSSPGVISLYFVWNGVDQSEAATQLDELQGRVAGALGQSVYSDAEMSLAEALGAKLTALSKTISVAESCTGGMIGSMLTEVPGSSVYFEGGVISYSNAVKSRLLDVESGVLEEHGAVSEPCARAMALGVRRLLGTDIGLSVTGVAGPGGGSEEKPVGTVFIGLAHGGDCEVRKLHLPGSRDAIRLRTCNLALDWVRRVIE
ncbi:MAG: competence/damage-inducible protein A [Acidobacteriota bacterium]|nr:MAG: competence/damage-inducible protein A [Acidobacteriota bacterium]